MRVSSTKSLRPVRQISITRPRKGAPELKNIDLDMKDWLPDPKDRPWSGKFMRVPVARKWAQKELSRIHPGQTFQFPKHLSPFQRLVLHCFAEKLGWYHETRDLGEGERFFFQVVVTRPKDGGDIPTDFDAMNIELTQTPGVPSRTSTMLSLGYMSAPSRTSTINSVTSRASTTSKTSP